MPDSKTTALTANTTPLITDILPMVDDPAGSPLTQKITFENFLKVLNGLTEDTSPDNAADFLLEYDTSASGVKKVKPQSITANASMWKTVAGTPVRATNTTFTVTGDYSSTTTYPFGKGVIFKWTETGTVRCAMQSIPQTYGAPNTTFTIVGDTMASIDATSLKYCLIPVEAWKFAVAGTIGATGTNVANTRYAEYPMRVIAADLQVGTAGTTNSTTIDINKGGTTMFTTKPTLATTVATSPTPFTANSATSLALADKVTIDVDAIQTTAAIDLYATLYVFPTRYLYL